MENKNGRSYLTPPTIVLWIFCFTLFCLARFEIFLSRWSSNESAVCSVWLPFTLATIVFIFLSLRKGNEEKSVKWVWIQGIFTLIHFWVIWATVFFLMLAGASERDYSPRRSFFSEYAAVWGIGIPLALWFVLPSLWYTIRASYLFKNFGQVPQWPSSTYFFRLQNPFSSSPLRPRRILLFLSLLSCLLFCSGVIAVSVLLRKWGAPGYFIGHPTIFSILSLVQIVFISLIMNGGEENEWLAWGSMVLSIPYSSMSYAFCLEKGIGLAFWDYNSNSAKDRFAIIILLFGVLGILVGVWTVFPSAYHTYKLVTTRREDEESGFSKLGNVDEESSLLKSYEVRSPVLGSKTFQ